MTCYHPLRGFCIGINIHKSILNFFKVPDINQGVEEYSGMSGAFLLDVRTSEEYREGHIPKSKNVPLQAIAKVNSLVKSKNSPIFVYCHSGARSRQAVSFLQQMGYNNVKNIGGIMTYKGRMEH